MRPNTRAPRTCSPFKQGADFVEQDLVLTKDGQLVCLHDVTLERTTNVEQVFPDRFIERQGADGPTKHWMAYDFTLAEIKQLDAGSWFDARFAGERVLTFQEAIDILKGKVGLYPELKSPDIYRARGVELAPIVIEALRQNGLDTERPADPSVVRRADPASAGPRPAVGAASVSHGAGDRRAVAQPGTAQGGGGVRQRHRAGEADRRGAAGGREVGA